MSLESQVSLLTDQTTALLTAVNIKKVVLDQAVSDAQAAATRAEGADSLDILDDVEAARDAAKDARDAALTASATVGSYPSSAASNVPRGLTQGSVGAITPGSGGTNGTFSLAWSGGNFAVNPTGTFTVAGGVLTAVTITGPGSYIGASPTVPTPSFAASSGLTGAAVALTAQFLVGSGVGYWVQSTDGLSLIRYKNVSGAATADNAVGALPLAGLVTTLAASVDGVYFSKFVEANGTGKSPSVYAALAFVNTSVYKLIVEAKKGERTRFGLFNNASLIFDCAFDLAAGTCTGTGASIQYVPARDSYRCIVDKTATATGFGNLQLLVLPASGGQPYTGNGTSGLYIAKAELYKDGSTTNIFPDPTNFNGVSWNLQDVSVTGNAVHAGGLTDRVNTNEGAITTLNSQVTTANAGIATLNEGLNGALIGDKFVEASGAGKNPSVYQYFPSFINTSAYEIGVRAKKGERFRLNIYSAVLGADCTFDLLSGTCTGTGASIIQLKKGEFLCKVNRTVTSTSGDNVQIRVFPASGGHSYTGDGTSGLYVASAYLYKDGVTTDLFTGNSDFNGGSWSRQDVTVTPNAAKFGGIDVYDDGHFNWVGKKVVTIGTSMEAGNAWQPTVAAKLGVTIYNFGVSGSSYGANAHYGSLGVYHAITTGVQDGNVATGGPGIPADADVVIMGGPYNDFGIPTPTPLGALGDTTTATFFGALYASLVAVMTRAPSAKIIMLTAHSSAPLISGVSSTYMAGYTNSLGNTWAQFQDAVEQTAKAYGVGFIDAGRRAGVGKLTAAANTSDGLHLDSANGGPLYGSYVAEHALSLARATYIR